MYICFHDSQHNYGACTMFHSKNETQQLDEMQDSHTRIQGWIPVCGFVKTTKALWLRCGKVVVFFSS